MFIDIKLELDKVNKMIKKLSKKKKVIVKDVKKEIKK